MIFLRSWKSIITACLIFYVSIIRIPPVKVVEYIPHFDKLVHFGMYFTLATCLFFDVVRTSSLSLIKKIAIMVVMTSLYGGLIEILQGAYFPPRTAEWGDFFADSLGALMAFYVFNRSRFLRPQKKLQ